MTAADDIRSHARVLNLRLRLGLVELAVIERWADQAILTDNGVHTELVDLCLAGKKGVKVTQALLSLLGGPAKSDDLMSALWAAKVDGLSGDELRHLADNLDPVL